ncbi:helix-turn-helix domain-containing protein [Flavobacterium aquicola]|uniref:AraC-like DNA-binding protein n=1 Tax=Flavobacterium aquicola TaxID=1682742 RepID=A0A3E0EFQ2_9FLAO|nr:AraC family transcriptional regulator [Flavobacterium aquicola]REG96480.1 AraC-like DNA-binding protein [Flavobacterium aquicola]
MKFKSKIVAHEEPIIAIETTDFYNQKSAFQEEKINIRNGKKEEITCLNLISDGMMILDIQMVFSAPQTIECEITGESIVMDFICCNNVEANIDQVESEKYTRENTHNILYTSGFNARFEIPALEEINYLTIILSLDYYYKLINEDWDLHKKFSKNIIEKKSGYLTPKYIPFNSGIQWIIHEIKNCKYKGAIKKMYLEAKIKELLILQLDSLIEKPQDTKVKMDQEDYNKILEVKSILDANFTNAPTLPELSRLVSLNEFKLKKGFKACFETTIKGYVTKLRMEHAKELFKNKDSNVAEVADKCGYKDVSHFSSAFKLFFGFTPISFRKLNVFTNFSFLFWNTQEMIALEAIELFMI